MIPILSIWSRASQTECPLPEPGRPRVLVVEDDLLVGAMAAEALEEAGFAVVTAASAEEAEVILSEGAFDVLFTDIDLGGRDGCDLAHRALKAQPGLAVVMTSGRWRRYHADRIPPEADFLAKPYRLSHMIGTVHHAARRASSQ